MVSRRTCLSLRRACKCNPARRMCKHIIGFDGISHCVNIRIACPVVVINPNSTRGSDFKTGIFCKFGLRSCTDCHNHSICGNRKFFSVFYSLYLLALYGGYRRRKMKCNAVVVQFFVQNLHHIIIVRCQYLLRAFYQGNFFSDFS